MIKELYKGKLTFITPCFCAGANQNNPEIRPSSIRGQLRWWFRVLGGTPDQELEVFGGVSGNARSSAVIVRVSDVSIKKGGAIKLAQNTIKHYLYYFAEVSGRGDGVHRTAQGNYIDTGSSFTLQISVKRELSKKSQEILDEAWKAFLVLGSIGLRSTRGCGCFSSEENSYDVNMKFKNVSLHFPLKELTCNSGMNAQLKLGEWLKDFRRNHSISGKHHSPLGFSNGRERESSALKLRPVQVGDAFLPLVYYTDKAYSKSDSILQLLP